MKKNKPLIIKNKDVQDIYTSILDSYFSDKDVSKRVEFEETEDYVKIKLRLIGTFTKCKNSKVVEFSEDNSEQSINYKKSYDHQQVYPVMWPFCSNDSLVVKLPHLELGSKLPFYRSETSKIYSKIKDQMRESERQEFSSSVFQGLIVLEGHIKKSVKISKKQMMTATALWWQHFVDKEIFKAIKSVYSLTSGCKITWKQYAEFSKLENVDEIVNNIRRLGYSSPILRTLPVSKWADYKKEDPLDIKKYSPMLQTIITDRMFIDSAMVINALNENNASFDSKNLIIKNLSSRSEYIYPELSETAEPVSNYFYDILDFFKKIEPLSKSKNKQICWMIASAIVEHGRLNIIDQKSTIQEFYDSKPEQFWLERLNASELYVKNFILKTPLQQVLKSKQNRETTIVLLSRIYQFSDNMGQSFELPDSYRCKEEWAKIRLNDSIDIIKLPEKNKKII